MSSAQLDSPQDEVFRLIVNSIPGFVCSLTNRGEVEFVSDQVLGYFGKSFDELKQWRFTDAVFPDDLPNVIETLSRSIQTGQPTEVELRMRRADGMYRWFLRISEINDMR